MIKVSPLLIGGFVLLFIFSAFFSASETAFTSISRVRLRQLRKSKTSKNRHLVSILKSPSRMISAILIGNNIANIWATSIATAIAIEYSGPEGITIATLIMTVGILIFAEILPKTLVSQYNETYARVFALPIIVIQRLLLPFIIFFSSINSFVLYALKHIHPESGTPLTEEELKTMVNAGKQDGSLEDGEHKLLNKAFFFTNTRVREIMIPRTAMTTISGEATISDAVSFFKKHQFSRVPVYDKKVDHILGMIHYKDILFYSGTDVRTPLRNLVRPLLFVPETQTTADLMVELKKSKQNLAIVIDEHGATAGLVTIDDAIASILGGIRDEYDAGSQRPIELVKVLGPNHIRVPGNIKLDDINTLLRTKLYSNYYETVGGYLLEKFNRLPTRNDSYRSENARLRVVKVSKRTIHTVDIFLNKEAL